MKVLWRCIECYNKAAPEVMRLGRCPNCQAWPVHKPQPIDMFRSYREGKMTPEGKIKAAVKRKLNGLGECYHHWPVQNGMGAPCLDCHGCYRGVYFAIECKAPGNVPTARQDETIRQIAAAGGYVCVISSLDGANHVGMYLEEAYGKLVHRHR